MLVHQEGNLEFGTDTIGTGYQHRLLHAGNLRRKQTAKAADCIQYFLTGSGCHILLHQFNRTIAGCHIHTGILVAL